MAFPSCFAALPVPPLPELTALHAALPPELRRIHPEDQHLTIAYFGRIDPALHAPLLDALAGAQFEGARVVLDAVLPLPSREHPSALTLTLEPGDGTDAIVALMNDQRAPLAAIAGTPVETRPPLPHVTFARPRGRRMTDARRDAVLAWADAQPALGCAVELGGLVLMRSRPPGGPGPHYEIVQPPR